jgi:hypothetical protein
MTVEQLIQNLSDIVRDHPDADSLPVLIATVCCGPECCGCTFDVQNVRIRYTPYPSTSPPQVYLEISG